MLDDVTPKQPRLAAARREVERLVADASIATLDTEKMPRDDAVEAEMGSDWAALYDAAHSSASWLVDFLPLRVPLTDHPPSSVPVGGAAVTNCRGLAEALFRLGPLSRAEYERTIQELGSEGETAPMGASPPAGASLFCCPGIAQQLAETGLLEAACAKFRLAVSVREVELLRCESEELERDEAVYRWLSTFLNDVNESLRSGLFAILPTMSRGAPSGDPPAIRSLHSLFRADAKPGDVLWVDDRFVNAFSARDGGVPIVSTLEVLRALTDRKRLTRQVYRDARRRLFSAGFAFAAVEPGDVIGALDEAFVADSGVVETHALSAIRKYVAHCLSDWQGCVRKAVGHQPGAAEPPAETGFLVETVTAATATLREVWQHSPRQRAPLYSDWVIANLFVDMAGARRAVGVQQFAAVDPSEQAVALSLMVLNGIALPTREGRQSGYLDWAWQAWVGRKLREDVALAAAVCQWLGRALRDLLAEATEGRTMVAQKLLVTRFLLALPREIASGLAENTELLDTCGVNVHDSAVAGSYEFDRGEFITGVRAAVNGTRGMVTDLGSGNTVRISLAPVTEPSGLVLEDTETGHDDLIADPLFELLSDSALQRTRAMERLSRLVDCDPRAKPAVVAGILAIEDPAGRFLQAEMERRLSASHFYRELRTKLASGVGVSPRDLLPPDVERLCWYFGFRPAMQEDKSFEESLADAFRGLSEEHGAAEAARRLAGLPNVLPAIEEADNPRVPDDLKRSILHALLRHAYSPMVGFHLVRILPSLAGRSGLRLCQGRLRIDPPGPVWN